MKIALTAGKLRLTVEATHEDRLPVWEVQRTHNGTMLWYSTQRPRAEAIASAKRMDLDEDQRVRVVHVGTGEVAFTR